MTTALLGLLSAALAAVAHGVIVRWLPGALQLLAIPVLGLAGSLALIALAVAIGLDLTVEDRFLIVVAASSLSIAYMFAFVGVLYDSPTLAIANAILDHGPEGMPESAFANFVARHPATESRLSSLLSTRLLARDACDRLVLGKVSPFMRFAAAYRRLCGLRSSTG